MNLPRSSGDEREPGNETEWLLRVEDALRRGEAPPEHKVPPPDDSAQVGPELIRDLLDQWPQASDLGELGTTRSTDVEQSTCSEEDWPDRPSAIPEVIGRFRLEEILGRGGFGVVFRAFDPEMGRFVALKIPRADPLLSPEIRRQFLREARAAARLDHPNLVPVFEAGEAGSACYIASAYCEGPTLRRWIDRGNVPLAHQAATRMALSLARAIDYVHGKGILHCDLKPGNILLDLSPDPGVDPIPRVTDFGLARLTDTPSNESTAGKPWGTPPYMAPEQIAQLRESIGLSTDVYAIGAILYELLTGEAPHRGSTLWELLHAVTTDPPIPPRKRLGTIPRDLDAIVMKCLEKRPERRYSSASDLADDLKRFLERRPTRARPLGPIRRSARWTIRHPTSAVVLVAMLSAVAMIVSYLMVLSRINEELGSANESAQAALKRERRHRYAATLALAQQDGLMKRYGPGQTRMRSLIPDPGSGKDDPRDFAWYFLDRKIRRERTILDQLGPGYQCWVATSTGLLLGNNAQGAGVWIVPPQGSSDENGLGPTRPVFAFRRLSCLDGIAERTNMAALSPDGRIAAFATGLGPEPDTLMLVDTSEGRILGALPLPDQAPIRWPQFLPGGKSICLGSGPYRRRLPDERLLNGRIDLESGESIDLILVSGAPRHMTVAPGSGRLFAFQMPEVPGGGVLEIWDLSSGTHVEGIAGEFTAMAASPEPGGPLALGTKGGMIQLRDVRNARLIDEWEGSEMIICLAFSPDGRRLISGGDRVAHLWEVESMQLLDSIDSLGGIVQSAAFIPGLPDIALGTGAGQVEIWHLDPVNEQIILEGHTDEVWGVAFSPDGSMIASVGGERSVIVRDARTGGHLMRMTGHEEWPSTLAFHPDGVRIATADFGGYVRIWDIRSGRLERSIKVLEDRVRCLAFSPGGRLLAVGGRDKAVQVWDAKDWVPVESLPFPGETGQVRGLAFAPDGRTLVSAADVSLFLWELGAPESRVRWASDSHMTCVAFSPDGSLIAAGDNRRGVTVREASDGRIRFSLTGLHLDEISDVTFSPDGRILAVAGQDRVITLIDLETGSHHLTLTGHEKGINALTFSPDGRTLASASHDRTVRLWWAGPGPSLSDTIPDAE